jgi:Ca2+-binding RTX toxin-like protein
VAPQRRPSTLDHTGQQWRTFARLARDAAQLVDDRGDRLYADQWAGDVADTYTEHRRKLTRDIRSAADLADTMGDELERVTAELTFAQRDLDDCIARASREVAIASTGPGMVVFYPEDENDIRCVEDCVREAEQIRNRLDEALLGSVAAMERTRGDWKTMASALDAVSNGTVEPFTMPPEVTGTFVIFDGDNVIINTGKGNDKVAVTIDPRTGEQVVTVNGVTNRYPADANITVRAGEGNDEINVEPGVKVHMTLLGGEGDDTIRGGGGDDTILGLDGHDKIYAGEGNDRVSGGADRDYIDGYSGDDILDGGRGNDTLYGLSGNDQLSGGEGQDYLEGGTGDDKLFGGAGNDILSGGRDNDTLFGGAGDDKQYGGFGTDTIQGGSGSDTSVQPGRRHQRRQREGRQRRAHQRRRLHQGRGSPEFVERVTADIDFMRSSPRGQEMLASLQAKHDEGWIFKDTLTIHEYKDLNSTAPVGHLALARSAAEVNFNPSLDQLNVGPTGQLLEGPPVVVFFHEMAHTTESFYDNIDSREYRGADNLYGDGTGPRNYERTAVGLPSTTMATRPPRTFATRSTRTGRRRTRCARSSASSNAPPTSPLAPSPLSTLYSHAKIHQTWGYRPGAGRNSDVCWILASVDRRPLGRAVTPPKPEPVSNLPHLNHWSDGKHPRERFGGAAETRIQVIGTGCGCRSTYPPGGGHATVNRRRQRSRHEYSLMTGRLSTWTAVATVS